MISIFFALILNAGWAQTARPALKPGPATPSPKAAAPVVPSAPMVKAVAMTAAELEKGRLAYMKVCIQCHNKDPHKKGNLGPELTDTPIEVMKYKVETGVYPPNPPKGFVPRRKTKAMRKLPQSVKDVPYIHAWIASLKPKQ